MLNYRIFLYFCTEFRYLFKRDFAKVFPKCLIFKVYSRCVTSVAEKMSVPTEGREDMSAI